MAPAASERTSASHEISVREGGGGRGGPRGLRGRNAQGGVRRWAMAMDVQQLVDTEQGLVSRRIFIEPEIYEQALVQIFARC